MPCIALAGGASSPSFTSAVVGSTIELVDATGRPTWLPSAPGTAESIFVPSNTSFETVEQPATAPLGLTDATGRPTWLPSPLTAADRLFAPYNRSSFETVTEPQVPGVCSDPATSAPAFVLLQRTGVCPAPRLPTRYER